MTKNQTKKEAAAKPPVATASSVKVPKHSPAKEIDIEANGAVKKEKVKLASAPAKPVITGTKKEKSATGQEEKPTPAAEGSKPVVQHRPTDSELEILKVIWQTDEATVRMVHEKIAETKNVGYTTTLKLMQIMHDKGILSRNTDTRTHVYAAAVSRDKTMKQILGRLIDTLFGGSTYEMLEYVLEHRKLGKKELESLKKHFKSDKKGK